MWLQKQLIEISKKKMWIFVANPTFKETWYSSHNSLNSLTLPNAQKSYILKRSDTPGPTREGMSIPECELLWLKRSWLCEK